ncbi:hypothetical protein ACQY0O_000877 [Thecaphora frezii]
MQLALSFILLALAGLVLSLSSIGVEAKTYAFGDINNPSLNSLTTGNFTSSIAHGMWLVEFYSPYCQHCKKFAPTWQDIAEYEEHLADSSDFHFARVNCITQGDLCGEQAITGYPSVNLFADGKRFEEYEGDRDFDSLQTYVEARAADWRRYKAGKASLGLL